MITAKDIEKYYIECQLPDGTSVKYLDIVEIGENKINEMLSSGNIELIYYGILSACYYESYDFALRVCMYFWDNYIDVSVRSNILSGLSVMCTRFKYIDHQFLSDVINEGMKDDDKLIRDNANMLLDYAREKIKGFKFRRITS